MYQWPKEDWAIHLIPLLTGKARSAFVAMDPSHTQDYDFVKTAILKKYEINAETYRLRFRNLNTPADESPQELYIRLKDLFCKCPLPSSSKGDYGGHRSRAVSTCLVPRREDLGQGA